MTVITMTREMGSLGKDVAAGLADDLGLEVIHHEHVEHDVAARMSLRESDVHRFLEGTPSLLERWKVGKAALCRCTAEEIFALAAKGDVIIRGWGATALLRRVPHVLRVRVCAPMPFRVDVMQKRLGLDDPDVARREIRRNDAAHTRIVRGMSNADWEGPLNYDLVLNTERVPIAQCVRQVRALAESGAFDESEGSRRILDDLATEARLHAAVADNRELGRLVGNLDITVEDGVARVRGVVHDRERAAELCRALETVPGVRSVEDRLVVPGAYAG